MEFDSASLKTIPASKFWILRLDGSTFTSFTRDLHKPFDVNFLRSMISTTNEMLEKFGAVTAYSQSDEISLIFAPSAC